MNQQEIFNKTENLIDEYFTNLPYNSLMKSFAKKSFIKYFKYLKKAERQNAIDKIKSCKTLIYEGTECNYYVYDSIRKCDACKYLIGYYRIKEGEL